MIAVADLPASVGFRRYRVLPHRREMIADGKPIKLGGRAFDILMALIEARGAVVTKDALTKQVWSGRVVEENNLQSHISALRAALGPDRDLIRTVSGRGYQFIGEIRVLSVAGDERASVGLGEAESGALAPTNVPEPVSELIGRDDELAEVVNLMGAHRFVTLTGPGGIGKTRLAVELARELRTNFADGVWLAQFSPLADPKLVPVAVAAAVGLRLGGEASVQSVAQGLAGRRLLLVLDTCEHVIEIAASMAEAALGAGSELRILATSRELLKAEGEWVYPVSPLTVPTADVEHEDIFEYGAIRLFLERARAADPRFAPDRPLAELIAATCRRLDGIPLAIELAAARASALGVEGLAARLDDRFRLLTGGKRTALPRHQTLRATLDWSYELLTEPERVILRRLAVFVGPFSLQATIAVAADPETELAPVVESLASLVAKSLVTTEGGAVARYRLLDTTRAYASEKLDESGERVPLARRHAEYYRDVFERADIEWESRPSAEWLADYAWRIDDVRAALDWAFSPSGNASLGVALTAATVPLSMHLSLLDECRSRVEQALAALSAGGVDDARREMRLLTALSATMVWARSAVPRLGKILARTLEIAESLGDTEYQLRSLRSLWFFHTYSGRHRVALGVSERFTSLAATRHDSNDRFVSERLMGASQHFLGDHLNARRRFERLLAHYVPSDRRSDLDRFQFDNLAGARGHFARILWLLGYADQAMRAAESSIDRARAINHALNLCFALTYFGCPVALLVGDLATAELYIRLLLDHSRRHGLVQWHAYGRCHQGLLSIKRGDVATGLGLLRTSLDEIGGPEFAFFLRLATLMDVRAEALACAGEIDGALDALTATTECVERAEELWIIPELLRRKGELLMVRGASGEATMAEDHFRQALDSANRQGALSWELRAATSLARLWYGQNRRTEARALLQPVYDRFTEGFDTADLKAAKALLNTLL
ncbi:ATP-binding protein [Bradyrhizobium erythrophlei]|uniref:Predicted ATPase n=1 Tax=Bradyrhizobium erythrophlei TaxID=1437360 RepID=A0A1M5KZS5_9BRAD|nr:winged helix-turn-helix domain-containing protein [Bradyrhizobium erythrophlei]SHG58251.1 Predicted ATPase [Bradyrhizobium erythrophlei]